MQSRNRRDISQDRPSKGHRPYRAFFLLQWAGILLSILWLTPWILVLYNFEASLDQILSLDPLRAAEFLAGVVGPLVLLWLVLGHFQQSQQIKWEISDRTDASRQRDVLNVAELLAEADANVDRAVMAIENLMGVMPKQQSTFAEMREVVTRSNQTTDALDEAIEQYDGFYRRLEEMKSSLGEISENNKRIWKNLYAYAIHRDPMPFLEVVQAVEHKHLSASLLLRIASLERQVGEAKQA